ncbi:RNA repair transcriptional activator RtcR [Candidatus Thiothrix sp. Deng01]|uniref:RNA repair transcriptional activator RtcR n=1 Tax=Candidatus Thiothrix phosphatis TaxID=3112415 RepID=A0ABU6D2C5_9GAMM|nr:RNA repair transcriptional activator RtcR [Candidatus Thiothrix sp. Deng01]MEB4592504.1 RNA repair transcriptional activator RtcR [Candidatus Thiothrix sp. Deng01]
MGQRNVVIGILGARLDQQGLGKRRWNHWRPNVGILMHPEFAVDEFVLIHHENEAELAGITLRDMRDLRPGMSLAPHVVNYANPWDFGEVYSQLLDFTRQYRFEPEQCNYYVHITTGTHVAQICLFLLTEANYIPGKLLQTSPSREGVQGTYQIIDLDLSRYDQIASRFEREAQEGVAYLKGGIETRNAAFNALIAQLEQVSIRSAAPILLTGPTGAGKSRLAKRIFELKKQRGQVSGKLVETNCATLRGDNAMSALFGHVKGAFTGALTARSGLLREADKGLLFLDEIGELGLDEQAMLLRAIEDKVFTPFGSDKETSSDFQLIAGTNRDLFQQVRVGEFREDLLARINLWTYQLPGLRGRLEDLEPNIEYELQQIARKVGHKASFNKAAREQYLAFAYSAEASWRANFRDLNSSITRMATLASGGRITEGIVAGEIGRLRYDWGGFQQETPAASAEKLLQAVLAAETLAGMDHFDKAQLAEVVRVCRASKSLAEAGRVLFNVSRTQRASSNDSHRLRVYLQKYGLSFSELA